jgi:hypothetical protein
MAARFSSPAVADELLALYAPWLGAAAAHPR